MRKLGSYLISIVLIALFSTSVYAAKNEICDPLKAKGVTKGLYGLCIAYHASGANSQVILDNYNRKKSDSDPVMPGTDDNPPTLSCECWNTLTADEIGTNLAVPVNSCFLSTEIDFLYYESIPEGQSETVSVASGSCLYDNTITGTIDFRGDLSGPQETICRDEILDLASRELEEGGCPPL